MASLMGAGRAALGRPRLQVLNLHHVFPDEEAGFRRLLVWLRDTGHTFVGYGEGVEAVRCGSLDRPSVAFTFDDGLESCVRAAEILEEFGARACFFVVTGLVGETDRGVLARFATERIHMPPVEVMDWDDVERLLERGHEIGSHTHAHPVVADLDPERMVEELEQTRGVLVARTGSGAHFSWPYGRFRHFSAEAATAVFDVGFATCASAERGAHVGGPALPLRSLCLRRDHCIAAWPLAHHRWFLGRAARDAEPGNNLWPELWRSAMPPGGEGGR